MYFMSWWDDVEVEEMDGFIQLLYTKSITQATNNKSTFPFLPTGFTIRLRLDLCQSFSLRFPIRVACLAGNSGWHARSGSWDTAGCHVEEFFLREIVDVVEEGWEANLLSACVPFFWCRLQWYWWWWLTPSFPALRGKSGHRSLVA